VVRSVEGMNETTTQDSTSVTMADLGRADASGAGRRRLLRAATIAAAIVLPLLVWAIAVPLAGLELVAGSGSTAQVIGTASIVFAVVVAGLVAWGVLALLERFTKTSVRTFAVVGWTVLVLSLLGPVLMGAVGAVLVVLLAMHLVTGAALVIGLPLAGRRRRPVPAGGE